MKELHLKLIVPDFIDPEEVLETMLADFWDLNKSSYEERFPDMDAMGQIMMVVNNEQNTKEGNSDVQQLT
jgi:hypothetical protein